MRSFDEITSDAKQQSPFSNGFQGESWMDRWCWAPCKKDRDSSCPLVLAAYSGYTPKEWTEVNPGGLADRYHCSEFEPDDDGGGGVEPAPQPQPVAELDGQVDMFEVWAQQITEQVPQREAVPA